MTEWFSVWWLSSAQITFIEGAEADKTEANMRSAYKRPRQLWQREAMQK